MKVKKSFNLTYQHLGKPMIKNYYQPHSRLRKYELQVIFNPTLVGFFILKTIFLHRKKYSYIILT